MRVMLFALKEKLGFSQGYAINVINQMCAGLLEAAGQVQQGWNEESTLLYVRKSYAEGEVKQSESLWADDGCGLNCVFKRVDNEPWERKQAGEWVQVGLELEFSDLKHERELMGLPA